MGPVDKVAPLVAGIHTRSGDFRYQAGVSPGQKGESSLVCEHLFPKIGAVENLVMFCVNPCCSFRVLASQRTPRGGD